MAPTCFYSGWGHICPEVVKGLGLLIVKVYFKGSKNSSPLLPHTNTQPPPHTHTQLPPPPHTISITFTIPCHTYYSPSNIHTHPLYTNTLALMAIQNHAPPYTRACTPHPSPQPHPAEPCTHSRTQCV